MSSRQSLAAGRACPQRTLRRAPQRGRRPRPRLHRSEMPLHPIQDARTPDQQCGFNNSVVMFLTTRGTPSAGRRRPSTSPRASLRRLFSRFKALQAPGRERGHGVAARRTVGASRTDSSEPTNWPWRRPSSHASCTGRSRYRMDSDSSSVGPPRPSATSRDLTQGEPFTGPLQPTLLCVHNPEVPFDPDKSRTDRSAAPSRGQRARTRLCRRART